MADAGEAGGSCVGICCGACHSPSTGLELKYGPGGGGTTMLPGLFRSPAEAGEQAAITMPARSAVMN